MALGDQTPEKLAKLTEVLRGGKTLLIVLQDAPDPDAIASAVALRRLANALADVQCSITHGGKIARGENLALVDYLRPSLRPIGEVDAKTFDLVALVDTQPTSGNNSLPEGIEPAIVIDHHPIRRATRRAPFTDVRKEYGATSTILHEYLRAANLAPEVPLATALLYGIRSDTLDMGAGATEADGAAIEALYPLANKRMLSRIQHGRVSGAYFILLAHALAKARLYGDCLVSHLGPVDNADIMAEVADLLLRHEQADWALCTGFLNGRMLLSLRSRDPEKHAERIIRKLVARRGSGGGHEARAGGQIPLRKDTARHRRALERTVRDRLLRAVGMADHRGKRLVPDPPKNGSAPAKNGPAAKSNDSSAPKGQNGSGATGKTNSPANGATNSATKDQSGSAAKAKDGAAPAKKPAAATTGNAPPRKSALTCHEKTV